MTRIVAVGLIVLASIASAGVAQAQGTLPDGASIVWDRFSVYDTEEGEYREVNDDELRRYLNLAHCQCARENRGTETDVQYEIGLGGGTTSSDGDVEFWVGTDCDNETDREDRCRPLPDKTIANVSTLNTADDVQLNLYDIINGVDNTAACDQREGTATSWILIDTDGDSDYDYSSSQQLGKTGIGIDTKPPTAVTDVSAAGSERSIVITFDPPEDSEDYYAFQALCTTLDDQPVFTSDLIEAKYDTAANLCGSTIAVDVPRAPLELEGEMQVTTPPAAFANLDEAFICGENVSGTASSLKIEGLENDRPYKVALLAIDLYGNVTATYLGSTVTPRPVIDFWEDLNERDSAVDGGCLLARTYGDGGPLTQALRAFRDDTLARSAIGRALIDAYYATLGSLAVESLPARIAAGVLLAPLVALALAWHYVTLPGLLAIALAAWLWRRRRRAARVAAAAACAAALAPGLAAADDFTPYWEDPSAEEEAALDAPGKVRWHAGIRVGPYIPDIDLQFPRNEVTGLGPYEAMFGDWFDKDGKRNQRRVWQVMPMLDVDRIVWDRFGQLGVGGSIGYMQKTAYAYEFGSDEDSPMRPRSTAAENTFRLVPLAATLTYRLTYLDDRWGIPIVPYVKGGLSYYVWWLTLDGDTASACDVVVAEGEECPDEDKARGGTAGVQVSAGLAVRAERIDAGAARSMRNSGLQHAGFYAEVFWARVDGFGSDTKLWVGDTTWFAGVNFEF